MSHGRPKIPKRKDTDAPEKAAFPGSDIKAPARETRMNPRLGSRAGTTGQREHDPELDKGKLGAEFSKAAKLSMSKGTVADPYEYPFNRMNPLR